MRDETLYTSLGLPEGSGLLDWTEDPSSQTALLHPASYPSPAPTARPLVSSVRQGRGQACGTAVLGHVGGNDGEMLLSM